jgi:hypothetical protein
VKEEVAIWVSSANGLEDSKLSALLAKKPQMGGVGVPERIY